MMKSIMYLGCLMLPAIAGLSQYLTTPPSGGNKKAWVGEQVGLTQVAIHYDRPAVKGREGKIWGQLVPVGFTDQGFGSARKAPWRAGANENTTIEFSTDVKVEGKLLPKGKYGFFIAYDPAICTLIFSRNSGSWGSYYYQESEDALRVTVKPMMLEKSVEWLRYVFQDQTANSTIIALEWEKQAIPFKVEVDLQATQLAVFRQELRTRNGFTWQAWDQAVQWCLQNNTNLEEALRWSDSATSPTFGGNFVFQPQATRALLLQKLGKISEADTLMKKALPLANMVEMHGYGRQLLAQKRTSEALGIFKANFAKHPDQFTTLAGMMRGYSATGDYKNALVYARKALALAPDSNNQHNLELMIKKLEAGQDIN